uniref:CCC domain-containing protein n=2 Tax=Lutzomyia longipalpis TaxID=7200 RepID=A0A1B0C8M6_LUTLO
MEMLWKFLVIAQFVTTIWGYFVMEAEAEVTTARAPSVQMPHKITDCPPGQLTDCREGYEEYYLEHSVSQKDAKKSLKEIIEKSKNYQRPAYCGECTSSIQKYCLSPHLLHDHCCCDLRHGKGELNIPQIHTRGNPSSEISLRLTNMKHFR